MHQGNLDIRTSHCKWLHCNNFQFSFHRSPRPTQTSAATFESLYRESTAVPCLVFRVFVLAGCRYDSRACMRYGLRVEQTTYVGHLFRMSLAGHVVRDNRDSFSTTRCAALAFGLTPSPPMGFFSSKPRWRTKMPYRPPSSSNIDRFAFTNSSLFRAAGTGPRCAVMVYVKRLVFLRLGVLMNNRPILIIPGRNHPSCRIGLGGEGRVQPDRTRVLFDKS